MENLKNKSKKIAILAMFSALSLVMFIIESAIPPLLPYAPGVKLGLSNVFVFMAVIIYGGLGGFTVGILKSVLGSVFVGNISALIYSLPATVCSVAVMWIMCCLFSKRFSIVAISVLSSAVFNIVQVFMSAAVMSNVYVLYYIPYILIFGSLAGVFVGSVIYFIVKYFDAKVYF